MPMTSEERSSKTADKTRGHGFVARLPLADVPSGGYILRVEARSSFGSKPAVTRDLEITVR
jgi:hypothetical protein